MRLQERRRTAEPVIRTFGIRQSARSLGRGLTTGIERRSRHLPRTVRSAGCRQARQPCMRFDRFDD